MNCKLPKGKKLDKHEYELEDSEARETRGSGTGGAGVGPEAERCTTYQGTRAGGVYFSSRICLQFVGVAHFSVLLHTVKTFIQNVEHYSQIADWSYSQSNA